MRNTIVLAALVATATVVMDDSVGNHLAQWTIVFVGFVLVGSMLRRRRADIVGTDSD